MFKKEKIKDLHYSVDGVISADAIQKAADEILTEYGKKTKMPGFRPGHVPLSVLRQKFNSSAMSEAIDKLKLSLKTSDGVHVLPVSALRP